MTGLRLRSFPRRLLEPAAYYRWVNDRVRVILESETTRWFLDWLSLFVAPRLFFLRNRRSWRNLIRGKTVAVVGPAPLGGDYSDVIEAHDVVIRVGFEHWPWPETGNRTDVWVLDGGNSRALLDRIFGRAGLPSTLSDLGPESEKVRHSVEKWSQTGANWVIIKAGTRFMRSEIFKLIFLRELGLSNTRCVLSRKPMFLRYRGLSQKVARTHLNQVPIALLELYSLKPASVAVFGSDYYTRPGLSYSPDSPSHLRLIGDPDSFIGSMLESHNQLHQKRIIRWVQERRGWPTGDPLFSRLTATDEEEFVRLFGGW